MKWKYSFSVLMILVISMISSDLIAQEESDTLLSDKIAYLYFYRSKQFVGSGNGIGIQINDNEIQRLKNGTRLIIEYSHINQPIYITSFNKINCLTAHSRLEINPEGGQIYYIEVNWDKIYDKERESHTQIAGLGINFIQNDEKKGKTKFFNNTSFKDKQNSIKRISID